MVTGIVLSLAGASTLAASTSAFYSIISTDTAGDPIDATALFGLDSTGDLTLTLTNLEANIKDVGQSVTGIKFNLSGLTGRATPSSQTGAQATVNSTTSLTNDGSGALLYPWGATTSLPTVTLSALGSGQPQASILGPETSGEYPNANGSIAGNGPHNPFVVATATFDFTGLGGLTNKNITTILSSVSIGFGTAGTDYVPANLVATPEPGSIILFLTGGIGLLVAGTRRRTITRNDSN
jgi:hypothetical protein